MHVETIVWFIRYRLVKLPGRWTWNCGGSSSGLPCHDPCCIAGCVPYLIEPSVHDLLCAVLHRTYGGAKRTRGHRVLVRWYGELYGSDMVRQLIIFVPPWGIHLIGIPGV
jgi:hypothetical protein